MTATRTLCGRAAHIAFGILIVLTVGLAPRAVGSAQAASPVLNWYALGNLTYDLPAAPGGKVKLVNGAYSAPIAEGSTTKFEVQLAPIAMLGDMTGGGLPDAAVVLVSKSGGSGTFYDLTVVLNINAVLKPLRPVHLGDRIAVRALGIDKHTLKVVIDTQSSSAHMTVLDLRSTRTYVIENDKLVQTHRSDVKI
jgi:hypothetical protein